MNKFKIILSMALLLVIAGCAKHFVLIKPERVAISKAFTVEPPIPWSGISYPEEHKSIWTVNGLTLDRVLFVYEIEDGKSLFDEESDLKFKKDMNSIELAELASNSFQASGSWPQVNMTQLRPQKFGTFDGFALDIETTSKAGLKYKGMVAGAVIDEKLNLIYFLATELYYYPQYIDHFKHLVASIQKA